MSYNISTVRTPLVHVETLSLLLRAARRQRGWTHAELGERLGVSGDRAGQIERAPGKVALPQLLAALHALGLDLVVESRPVADETPPPMAPEADTPW
ncbi:MAG: helix-turn-helix transcriptional regulator [Gemmatimonadaceae bacterium]|jgi:transcriptional regulator with XRE-family HTH domain|nr:helix-turn-helix transcriptional regulator [Gemmatimonadaceae bacterium]